MKKIEYHNGTVLVDDADYEAVMSRTWHIMELGHNKYAVRLEKIDGKYRNLSMHRFILGITDSKVFIDHINKNGLDNRRENMRLCTAAENCRNKRKHKDGVHSKYIGVTWHNIGNRWYARIVVDGKTISLKTFKTEIEAAKAYNDAAIKYFGEFASLNTF